MSKWVLDQADGELDYPTLGFTAQPDDILDATAAPDGRWSLNGDQGAAETVTRYTIGGDPSYVEPGDGHILAWSDEDNAYVPTAPVALLEAFEGALSDTINTLVPTASTTAQGKVELATNGEVTTGTDTARAVTPAGVKAAIDARTASTTAQGIVELATNAEVETAADTARAVTPAGLLHAVSNGAVAAGLTTLIQGVAIPRFVNPIVHLQLSAGQSNAAPLSSQVVPTTEVDEPRILEWISNSNGVQTLRVMPAAQAYAGAWRARARLAELPPDHYIVVISAGVGSTGFTEQTATVDAASVTCSWDPANATAAVNLYTRMVTNYDAARTAALALNLGQVGAPTIVDEPLFWSQGENDRTLTKAQYITYFTALAAAWRTHTGVSTYWITLGGMTPELFTTSPENTIPIELALEEIPATVKYTAYVPGPKDQTNWNTSPWDPVSVPAGDKSQQVHWSAQGQRNRSKLLVNGDYRAKLNTATADPRTPYGLRARCIGGTIILAEWEPSESSVTSYDIRYAVNGANAPVTTKTIRAMGPLGTKLMFEIAPSSSLSMQVVRIQVRSNNETGASFWSDWYEVLVPSNLGSPGLDLTGGGFFWSTLGIGKYGDEVTSWTDLRANKAFTGSVGSSPIIAAAPDGGQVLRFSSSRSLSVAALGATFKSVAIVCKVQNLTASAPILSAGSGDMSVTRNTSGDLVFNFVGSGTATLVDTSTVRADGVTQVAGAGKWAQNWMTIVVSSSSSDTVGQALANTVSGSAASAATGFTDLTIGSGQIDVRAVYAYNGATAKTTTEMATAVAMAKASYSKLFTAYYPAVS